MDGLVGGLGQAAQVPARAHGADEDAAVIRVGLHADAVAQDSAAGEGGAGVDGQHADAEIARPQQAHQAVDQGALAGAGRPGHAQHVGVAAVAEQRAEHGFIAGGLVLSHRDGAPNGPWVATPDAGDDVVGVRRHTRRARVP